MFKLHFTYLILFSLVQTIFGLTLPDITTFIVNGTRANKGQFPYLVSIRVGGSHNCGGAIIDKRFILTAAHCASDEFDTDILSVVTGSELLEGNGDTYGVDLKIPHTQWDSKANLHDIALLKLDRDIELRPDQVEFIAISTSKDIPDNSNVTVAGWGYTHYPSTEASPHLLYTHVNVVGNNDCNQRWAQQTVIASTHLCVHNPELRGTCLGDSGSPYILDKKVIGVHIFGDWCKLKKPSVATRVYNYLSWIETQMRNNK